jgi:DNA adenine methylase
MKLQNQIETLSTHKNPAAIVNVAMVPQRSPFRYPGGKTWLVPLIRRWLKDRLSPVSELIEPFAGGAIVGLTAGFESLAARVTLIERDPQVAAVWRSILNGDGDWLADRISTFELSKNSIRQALGSRQQSDREKAFTTILRNRVQRGGILASGAGVMKAGENGRGIQSRWYPETLRRRILAIAGIKDRFRFFEGDGIEFIRQNAHRRDVAFFIDPPYTVAGRRLYTYSDVDHDGLFQLATTIAGDFLMTYDDVGEIRRVAAKYHFDTEPVAMKNTHHAKMTELLIGRNLDWARFRSPSDQVFPEFAAQTSRG